MAHALLLALTCAAAASAARYGDYSGVKMPAYGGGADYEVPRDVLAAQPSEDYHGHSPDAPASLDYKYEEEPRIKTEKPTKDSEDPEIWRKPGRKQRGLMRPMDSGSADIASKYERDEDDVPKFKTSHRYPKHRSRLKTDVLPRDEESPPRRPTKYSRDRKDDVSDIDRKYYFPVDKEEFADDKNKDFDEDVKFMNEPTTRRVNRRKQRDRHNMKRKISDLKLHEDELEVDRRMKPDIDIKEIGERRGRPSDMHARERYRPVLEDDDEEAKVHPLPKPKEYDDYDDYYDMKRVYSIKSNLPSLLRRSSVTVSLPTPTSLLEMLWSDRRMMDPDSSSAEPEYSPPSIPTTSTTTTAATTTTTTTTTTTPTTYSTTVSTTIKFVNFANKSELSLAEKSRLSILKKDQRKEGQHVDPTTKKPPVLLQVTKHLPTVVMVEPPSSMAPWMRAREFREDSPERLDKVKKLMRHKLVAEAKSIHQLTDNWDDLVCDYIDVSLLDNNAGVLAPPRRGLLPLLMYLVFLIY